MIKLLFLLFASMAAVPVISAQTVIANPAIATCGGGSPCTISSINATGTKLLAVSYGIYNSHASASDVSSSPSNTFTCVASGAQNGNQPSIALCYVINPSVSSSMSVTVVYPGLPGGPVSLSVIAFGGTGSFVASSNFSNFSASVQPGSLSPTGTYLFVTAGGFAFTPSTTCSIDSSFTQQACVGHAGITSALAYKSSSTAENPTWSFGPVSTGSGAAMATFTISSFVANQSVISIQ